jgi:hypothetical protein
MIRSGCKHTLDSRHDFIMFQQFASPSRAAAFFDCFDEPRIVFEHAVDRFHDELRGIAASARGEIFEACLLLR